MKNYETKESLEKLLENEGFVKTNNISVISATETTCTLRMEIKDNIKNPYQIVHGGATFGLGDTVMGMTTRMFGKKSVTLNSHISYLRPGTGKYLDATSEIIKKGKNICVLRANIYNDSNILVAVMEGTYSYID